MHGAALQPSSLMYSFSQDPQPFLAPVQNLLEGSRLLAEVLGPVAQSPNHKAATLSRVCKALCGTHRIEVSVQGHFSRLPKILVANHLSYIDPIAICSVAPCTPLAKAEVLDWPLVGRLAARCNTLFVRRGDAHSGARALLSMSRVLEHGGTVLNFPEGTTTNGPPLRFQQGVFGLARLVGVPVVPVTVHFDDPAMCWIGDDAFVPHYLKSFGKKPHRVSLTVGPELYALDFPNDDAFAEATRSLIAAQQRRAKAKAATRKVATAAWL